MNDVFPNGHIYPEYLSRVLFSQDAYDLACKIMDGANEFTCKECGRSDRVCVSVTQTSELVYFCLCVAPKGYQEAWELEKAMVDSGEV